MYLCMYVCISRISRTLSNYYEILFFFRWYMVFSYLGVVLGAQIVFLSKGVSVEASLEFHFYSSVLLCIGWLFRIRLLDTDLFQPTGVVSRNYAFEGVVWGYAVYVYVWLPVLKLRCDSDKLAMHFSWNLYFCGNVLLCGFCIFLKHVFVKAALSDCSCW